jgi:hypothetical protein
MSEERRRRQMERMVQAEMVLNETEVDGAESGS